MTGLVTSDPPSDAGLVHSALGGDVASFSALLDRYRVQVLFHDGADQVRRALGYFQPRPGPKQD